MVDGTILNNAANSDSQLRMLDWQHPLPVYNTVSYSFSPYFRENVMKPPHSWRVDLRYLIESEVIRATDPHYSRDFDGELDAHINDIDVFIDALRDAGIGSGSITDARYQDCQFRGFRIGFSLGVSGLLEVSLKCRCIAYDLPETWSDARAVVDRIAGEHGFVVLDPQVGEASTPGYFQGERPLKVKNFVFEVD